MSVDTSTISPDAPTPSPCKDETADLILRSSDGVDFRTHKFILSAASTFFEGLLSVPQPPSTSTEEIVVVPFDLEHLPLNYLIRLCYPVPADTAGIDSLSCIESVLRAAHKYDMSVVTARLETVYLHIGLKQIEEDPGKAFVIACQYKWGVAARLAAQSSLKFSMDDLIKKLATVVICCDANDLQQLYMYHFRCRNAIRLACETPRPVFPSSQKFSAHTRTEHIVLGDKAFDVAYTEIIHALGTQGTEGAPMRFINTLGLNVSRIPVESFNCTYCRKNLADCLVAGKLIQEAFEAQVLESFRAIKLTFSWDVPKKV
ncbi:hypothetical protein ONZ45_g13769 [Pleurotus djamor]|nr:hypothetical protein ONZ45_g13769 [Pleurotus djamor]